MDVYLQIADAIKKDVSKILHEVIFGSDEKYHFRSGLPKWGLVEKDIHAAIERHLTEASQPVNSADAASVEEQCDHEWFGMYEHPAVVECAKCGKAVPTHTPNLKTVGNRKRRIK